MKKRVSFYEFKWFYYPYEYNQNNYFNPRHTIWRFYGHIRGKG